jgi:preprotein translocase subunit SecY
VGITSMLGQGKPLYMIIYAAGIIFFSFFYTSIIFNPKETAENLRKYGGFVPGIRPGEQTEQFIDQLLLKLTAIGSLYLVLIGTSLLIVAVVAMDTVAQVQTRLMSQQYESLIKKTKFNR